MRAQSHHGTFLPLAPTWFTRKYLHRPKARNRSVSGTSAYKDYDDNAGNFGTRTSCRFASIARPVENRSSFWTEHPPDCRQCGLTDIKMDSSATTT
jgi:hypothetical protein